MYIEIGNFEESEFRLSDEKLIKFYNKFNLQELKNMYIIMTNVEKYSVSAEINILKKIIEKLESSSQYNQDEPLDNILKKTCFLSNREIRFLYVMNQDANYNFKHITEYYNFELGKSEKQYDAYVDQTNKIESKLYNELVKINSNRRIHLKFKEKSLNN